MMEGRRGWYGSVLDLVDGSLRAKGEDPWVFLQEMDGCFRSLSCEGPWRVEMTEVLFWGSAWTWEFVQGELVDRR